MQFNSFKKPVTCRSPVNATCRQSLYFIFTVINTGRWQEHCRGHVYLWFCQSASACVCEHLFISGEVVGCVSPPCCSHFITQTDRPSTSPCLMSPAPCLVSPPFLPHAFCLMSSAPCLMSPTSCLLPRIFCLLPLPPAPWPLPPATDIHCWYLSTVPHEVLPVNGALKWNNNN